MTPQELRAAAVAACLARFQGKTYAPGKNDDVRMTAHLLHHLGVAVPILKGCKWSCERSGMRLLKRKGFDDLHAAVDALGLPRIGWASARMGDLIALPSTCGVGALAVHTGNGAMLTFLDGHDGAVVARIADALHAWRTV